MSGSDLQGRWMPSSVTEEDVLKLREAKYLAYEISHRLPAEGQAIPTPEPGEYVIFVSHLRRGLGFSMDPFVRGLMMRSIPPSSPWTLHQHIQPHKDP